MALIWLTFYCLLILGVGYAACSAIFGAERKSWRQLISLSLLLGTGGTGVVLLWLSFGGLKPDRATLAIVAGGTALALGILGKGQRLTCPASLSGRALSSPEKLCLTVSGVIVLVATVVIGVHALALPVYEWDAIGIWGFKARVLASQSLHPTPSYFRDPGLSYSHQDYPLLVPILTAGAYGAMGNIYEPGAKIVCVLFYVGLGLMIYDGLRWRLARGPAALLTAVCLSLPTMVRWAGAAIADVPMTFFYAASVTCLLRWLDERSPTDLLIALASSAFCAMTKAEGFALAAANILVLLLFSGLRQRKTRISITRFIIGFGLLVLPWWLWSRGLPHTHENYAGRVGPQMLLENAGRLKTILGAMMAEAVDWRHWGALTWLLVVAAGMGWRAFRAREIRAGWALLALHLGVYVMAFWVTPWEVREHLGAALDRLLLHAAPLVTLLIGWHFARVTSFVPTERQATPA